MSPLQEKHGRAGLAIDNALKLVTELEALRPGQAVEFAQIRLLLRSASLWLGEAMFDRPDGARPQ